MSKVVLLDTGPLGMVSHPRPNRAIVEWVRTLLQSGAEIVIPEIADYEVRRELLRAKKAKGVRRLDELKVTMGYVPLTTEAMLKAAEFWAEPRRRGHPTAKDDALDGDVILAGQAATLDVGTDELVIATTNAKHLSRFARAELWDQIR
jgi:predicted nucleic acid-binding protein